MREYTIYIDSKKAKKEIKRISELFLKKDELWHFNYYDGFVRLKVSKKYPKLSDYILSKKWRWEENPYNQEDETLPVFKRNFDNLIKVLHSYAVMLMAEKDIDGIEDRIMHLFLNMRGYSYLQEAKTHANHALRRAYLQGLYEGFNKAERIV